MYVRASDVELYVLSYRVPRSDIVQSNRLYGFSVFKVMYCMIIIIKTCIIHNTLHVPAHVCITLYAV